MSNPIKDIYDKASLTKDIAEREKIIQKYQNTGFLDREDAIKKILELRLTNNDVKNATYKSFETFPFFSVPFNQSTNEQIVAELAVQKDILQEKLIEKQLEDKENG